VKDLIPYTQAGDDPWVRRFDTAYRETTGELPVHDRMVAWSDAAHPAALFGVPTALYGPGLEGTAHSSQEHVEIAALVRCTKVIATFLRRELSVS